MQYNVIFLRSSALPLVFSLSTKPLKSMDGADPFMIYVEGSGGAEGYYYLLNTNGTVKKVGVSQRLPHAIIFGLQNSMSSMARK